MNEHPAHYANVILEKEAKKLFEQLKVANGGELPSPDRDPSKDSDQVKQLLKKMRQISMAMHCIEMEL